MSAACDFPILSAQKSGGKLQKLEDFASLVTLLVSDKLPRLQGAMLVKGCLPTSAGTAPAGLDEEMEGER